MFRSVAAPVLALCVSFGMPVSTGVDAFTEAVDISGHWEGAVQVPDMMLDFHIDVARDASGGYAGTISLPGEHLRGLPLAAIALDGHAIRFSARTDQTFAGTVAEDGRAITGEFSMKAGTVPFRLARTGDAQIEPRPSSPRVSDRLAGAWQATLSTSRGSLHMTLTVQNHPDGTASGSLVNVDEGGLELPLAIAESAGTVTLRTTPIDSSFSGTLDAEGTVLDGTFSQGAQSVPVTFRRAAEK
jgi:hypothetical protein